MAEIFSQSTTTRKAREQMKTTGGGRRYIFRTCLCDRNVERCNPCLLDYVEMNQKAKLEAEGLDKSSCASQGCLNKRGSFHCGDYACPIRYCSKECQLKDTQRHVLYCEATSNGLTGRNKTRPQVNISIAPAPDKLVDLYPVGTRLTMSLGRRRDPSCTIVAFKLGVDRYHNPAVQYNPSKYPNLYEEMLCSYRLQYSDGSIEDFPCYEVHDRWMIPTPKLAVSPKLVNSPPVEGGSPGSPAETLTREGSSDAGGEVVAGEQGDLDLEADLPFPISIPSTKRVLIVNLANQVPFGTSSSSSGVSLLTTAQTSFVKEVTAQLTKDNTPFETLDGDVDVDSAALIRLLLSGRFSVCVIIGFGSLGPSVMRHFTRDDVNLTIRSWVAAGGRFFLHGEGCAGNLMNIVFDKHWYFRAYETAKSQLRTKSVSSPVVRASLPAAFEVHGHALENVEKECQLYRYATASNKALCTVATSTFGRGRLTFLGAVAATPQVVQIIDALSSPVSALTASPPPSSSSSS